MTPLQIYNDVLKQKHASLRTIRRWIADYQASGKTEPNVGMVGRPITVCTRIHKEKVRVLLKQRKSVR